MKGSHRQRACNLTSGVASHAIADHVEAQLLVHEVVVLVVVALLAHVRQDSKGYVAGYHRGRKSIPGPSLASTTHFVSADGRRPLLARCPCFLDDVCYVGRSLGQWR